MAIFQTGNGTTCFTIFYKMKFGILSKLLGLKFLKRFVYCSEISGRFPEWLVNLLQQYLGFSVDDTYNVVGRSGLLLGAGIALHLMSSHFFRLQ